MNQLETKNLIIRRVYRSILSYYYKGKPGLEFALGHVDNLKEPEEEWDAIVRGDHETVLSALLRRANPPVGIYNFTRDCFLRYLNREADLDFAKLKPLHNEVIAFLTEVTDDYNSTQTPRSS